MRRSSSIGRSPSNYNLFLALSKRLSLQLLDTLLQEGFVWHIWHHDKIRYDIWRHYIWRHDIWRHDIYDVRTYLAIKYYYRTYYTSWTLPTLVLLEHRLVKCIRFIHLYNNGKKGPEKCAFVCSFCYIVRHHSVFSFVCLFVFLHCSFVCLKCASPLCAFVHLLCYELENEENHKTRQPKNKDDLKTKTTSIMKRT